MTAGIFPRTVQNTVRQTAGIVGRNAQNTCGVMKVQTLTFAHLIRSVPFFQQFRSCLFLEVKHDEISDIVVVRAMCLVHISKVALDVFAQAVEPVKN